MIILSIIIPPPPSPVFRLRIGFIRFADYARRIRTTSVSDGGGEGLEKTTLTD